jgi:hypothetical protein
LKGNHRGWLTNQKIRLILHAIGCLRPKLHAKACLEAGRSLRCYVAHPPTWEDEVAAGQRWFIRLRNPITKPGWGDTLGGNKRVRRLKPVASRLAHESAEATHEVDTTMANFRPMGITGPVAYKGHTHHSPAPGQKRSTTK